MLKWKVCFILAKISFCSLIADRLDFTPVYLAFALIFPVVAAIRTGFNPDSLTKRYFILKAFSRVLAWKTLALPWHWWCFWMRSQREHWDGINLWARELWNWSTIATDGLMKPPLDKFQMFKAQTELPEFWTTSLPRNVPPKKWLHNRVFPFWGDLILFQGNIVLFNPSHLSHSCYITDWDFMIKVHTI